MISKSKNLKLFKDEVGNLNHFLITVEVGLHNIDADTRLPEDFRSSWNPKDYRRSVERSEQWARKSALTYICSAVEAYFEGIFVEPTLIQDNHLLDEYHSKKSSNHNMSPSIFFKLNKVNDTYDIADIEKDLVLLMTFWRNGLVHHLDDFTTNPKYVEVKQNLTDIANKQYFLDNYCNLDTERLINDFEAKRIPTFKEITSMVRATIRYVHAVDEKLLNFMNKTTYVNQCISKCMDKLETHKKKEFERYTLERKHKYLKSQLEQVYSFEKGNNVEFEKTISDYLNSM